MGSCAHAAIAGCGTAPTWSQVYAQVIDGSCNTCHGTKVGAGGLPIGNTADSAYPALVNQSTPDNSCNASLYIKPGDAVASLVYLKVTGGGDHGCGGKMPPSGGPLSSTLSNLVKDWINAGAKK